MKNRKRLKAEIKTFATNPPHGIRAEPVDGNLMKWKATIEGPEQTPYEGGVFELSIKLPDDYPVKPPSVMFVTKVFHPNVGTDGSICVDMLKDMWSPLLTLEKVLLSILSLLTSPNPDSPLNSEAAKLCISNVEEYERTIRDLIESQKQSS